MRKIITKEECIKKRKHETKIFTSCFPNKRFCYYCMTEILNKGE